MIKTSKPLVTPPIKEYETLKTPVSNTLPTVKGVHYESVNIIENDESDLYNYFWQDHKIEKQDSSICLEAHETLEIPTLL